MRIKKFICTCIKCEYNSAACLFYGNIRPVSWWEFYVKRLIPVHFISALFLFFFIYVYFLSNIYFFWHKFLIKVSNWNVLYLNQRWVN